MPEELTIEQFAQAINDLPPEMKDQLASVVGSQQEVDTISIKMDLMKFATELRKHNQGVDWETNKQKPKKIQVEDIIKDAKTLFDFIVE